MDDEDYHEEIDEEITEDEEHTVLVFTLGDDSLNEIKLRNELGASKVFQGVTSISTPAPIPGTLNKDINPGTAAEAEEDNREYYKASDMNNFDEGIKKVFSEDKFACCLPGGTQVSTSTKEEMCCTGNIANTGSGARCCLPDYTNVTVYLNRYITNEMKDFPDTDFDPVTGRPLSIQKVAAFAQNICCSGKYEVGQAFGEMGIPGVDGFDERVNRFVSENRSEDNINNNATNYDRGLRWNTDVYCVP